MSYVFLNGNATNMMKRTPRQGANVMLIPVSYLKESYMFPVGAILTANPIYSHFLTHDIEAIFIACIECEPYCSTQKRCFLNHHNKGINISTYKMGITANTQYIFEGTLLLDALYVYFRL